MKTPPWLRLKTNAQFVECGDSVCSYFEPISIGRGHFSFFLWKMTNFRLNVPGMQYELLVKIAEISIYIRRSYSSAKSFRTSIKSHITAPIFIHDCPGGVWYICEFNLVLIQLQCRTRACDHIRVECAIYVCVWCGTCVWYKCVVCGVCVCAIHVCGEWYMCVICVCMCLCGSCVWYGVWSVICLSIVLLVIELVVSHIFLISCY